MTIFCGGPVFAMAWLPTPHILLRCNQILAVAVGNSFDSTYLTNTNYSEPSVIQFWDCGVLKNKVSLNFPRKKLPCSIIFYFRKLLDSQVCIVV